MPGMPNPEKVATSIHACATGGFTTWLGPLLACAPAAPAARAIPIPSNERFLLFMRPSRDSNRCDESGLDDLNTPPTPSSDAKGRVTPAFDRGQCNGHRAS